MPNSYTNFSQKISSLGFKSYDEYLVSPHWQDFKKRFYSSSRRKSCLCCELPNFEVELHHITYARLGKERLSDVIPVCRYHHEIIHQLLSEHYNNDLSCTLALVAFLAPEKEDRPKPLHVPDNRRKTPKSSRRRRSRGATEDDFEN